MKKLLISLGIILALVIVVKAQNPNAHSKHSNLEDGLALQGYDPVAYFTKGKAIEGLSKWSFIYQGAQYYFSSVDNLNLFKSNPTGYEPQYGGWCAYAMGESGEKVEVDPKTFKVFNGKLYLFYNFYFNNTLKTWNQNEIKLKSKADENWNKIIRKP